MENMPMQSETYPTMSPYALAAGLARGQSLAVAVAGAKKFLHQAIARQLVWKRGRVHTRALQHGADGRGR